MRKIFYTTFLSSSLLFIQCGKARVTSPPPVPDTLPPVTQEGKNSFGSLLNGQVLIPKGNNGRNNPSVQYDPTSANGSFSLYMYNISKGDSVRQSFQIGAKNLHQPGTYPITTPMTDISIIYNKSLTGTNHVWEYNGQDIANVKQEGSVTITKLDLNQQIISGTFSCTLIKKNSDTIRVSDGRFDVKF